MSLNISKHIAVHDTHVHKTFWIVVFFVKCKVHFAPSRVLPTLKTFELLGSLKTSSIAHSNKDTFNFRHGQDLRKKELPRKEPNYWLKIQSCPTQKWAPKSKNF